MKKWFIAESYILVHVILGLYWAASLFVEAQMRTITK